MTICIFFAIYGHPTVSSAKKELEIGQRGHYKGKERMILHIGSIIFTRHRSQTMSTNLGILEEQESLNYCEDES